MRLPLIALAAMMPVAAQAQLSPGRWEVTTTVERAEMPGAPAFVAGLLKGKPIKASHCLTPREAADGPRELMKQSDQCRFDSYEAKDGKVEAVMACTHDGGATSVTSSGNYTATGFTARSRSVTTGAREMTLTADTIGRRTGDCD